MKTKVIMLLSAILCVVMPFTAFAEETNPSVNTYEFDGITVEFDEDCTFDLETQRAVAEYLAYGDDGAEPYNLLCSIFGHSYETSNSTKTVHKVKSTAPRCRKDYYKVSVCSRCGDTQSVLSNSTYIYCCE